MVKPVRTPCVGICSTGMGDAVCRGCKRFAHEVIEWNSYTADQRFIIIQRLDIFLTQIVKLRLEVVDSKLLSCRMREQNIYFEPSQNPHCWLYSLLRAGAGQIGDPAHFGFRRLPEHRDTPLAELREAIDREFYALSEAHYQRYFAAAEDSQ